MTKKSRLIIVDDHQMIIDGLSRIIAEEPDYEIISTYSNPKEALQKVPILKPDILLCDLEMPNLNGLELVMKVKEELPELKTILLTMHLDHATVKKAMKIGFDAYILKNLDEHELKLALQQVSRGQKYFSYEVTEVLSDKSKVMEVSKVAKTASLTPREREVLQMVAEAYSTKEISEKLFISISTVETHRKALIKKLEAKNVAGLVRIAVSEGLVG